MKYFIDTEFIEGFYKPLFGKRRHFIDLISIGIVCEDGREYYAISDEWNFNDADKWVQLNVISELPLKIRKNETWGQFRKRCLLDEDYKGKWIEGKSNKQIAEEIINFIYSCEYPSAQSPTQKEFVRMGKIHPEFHGYYADYDWVLFCSLFGRMIDLPTGFPMYCRDLKQMLDEKVDKYLPQTVWVNKCQVLEHFKTMTHYPKQENEHNALADAKWNFELYKFLQTL